jgi:hypothetical protein
MSLALMALVAVALAAAGFAHILAPVEGRRTERELLHGEQRQLLRRADESERFIRGQEHLLGEITQLQRMMRDVDPTLYRSRLQRLDAAKSMLREQIRVEHELMDEYAKTHRILEVEAESARVVGRLEDGVVETMERRLAELDAAREANREMRFQLEANEEVERLLRGDRGL